MSNSNHSLPVLEYKDVQITYQDSPVIENCDWQVTAGSIVGIFGENGAGKSSLLKATLGLVDYSGDISYKGQSLNRQLRAAHFGYVPQFYEIDRLFPLTVKELIELEYWAGGVKDPQRQTELLEQLRVGKLLEKQLKDLSGGQLQRVLIARALMSKPDVLLFDEPTASLDKDSIKQFSSVLRELKDRSVTSIIVTHNHEFLHTLSSDGEMYEISDKKVRHHVHS